MLLESNKLSDILVWFDCTYTLIEVNITEITEILTEIKIKMR